MSSSSKFRINPRGSNGHGVVVRKGAWTHEEDLLLKKCVEKFGEGKWHQVPLRAGLRRCRKSCRLRWLNYLRPNIKRGEFLEEEVDLIIRLHTLLGNKWSLIARRIPGRTANDIKNYWNAHLSKKLAFIGEMEKKKINNKSEKKVVAEPAATSTIIKPQPRALTPNRLRLNQFSSSNVESVDTGEASGSVTDHQQKLPPVEAEYQCLWWESLLVDDGDVDGGNWSLSSGDLAAEEELVGDINLFAKEMEGGEESGSALVMGVEMVEWDDLFLDVPVTISGI